MLQDKDGGEDTHNAKRLNDIIMGKEVAAAGAGGGAGASIDAAALGIGEEEMMAINALPPAERAELMISLGLMAPGASFDDMATPASTRTPAVPPPVREPQAGVDEDNEDGEGDEGEDADPPPLLDNGDEKSDDEGEGGMDVE